MELYFRENGDPGDEDKWQSDTEEDSIKTLAIQAAHDEKYKDNPMAFFMRPCSFDGAYSKITQKVFTAWQYNAMEHDSAYFKKMRRNIEFMNRGRHRLKMVKPTKQWWHEFTVPIK